MSERIYASDGCFLGVTGDEKDARIAELEAELDGINDNHARRMRLLQDDRAKAERRAEHAEAELAALRRDSLLLVAELRSLHQQNGWESTERLLKRWVERGDEG
jgi:hypothetical protein